MKALLRRLTPPSLWRALRGLNQWRRDAPFRVLQRQGWVAARKDDFYSPLPVLEDLTRNRSRWDRPSGMPGIKLEAEAMRTLWFSLHELYGGEYAGLPPYEQLAAQGFGVGFTKADGRALYYMLRHIRPRRYLEIGAGLSTYFCHLARERNRAHQKDIAITCIEPFPREALRDIDAVRLIKDEVQNVPLDAFRELESGDILFIDSSHAAKIDSDVTFLMMEVVPRVSPGVYVHIHDIPFPYNFPYPPDLYIFGREWPMFWNEAVVVQAFLQFNDSFEIVLSLPYLRFRDPEGIQATIPDVTAEQSYANAIGSLWLRRTR